MSYSTIPAVKAQIITTLDALADLTGVLVRWGVPVEVPAERERIYVDDATNVTRAWGALGRYKIEETYTVSILVEVYHEGDDARTCEERMWTIVALIEAALVADVTLGGNLLQWGAKPGAMSPKCIPAADGWLAFVSLALDCKARI